MNLSRCHLGADSGGPKEPWGILGVQIPKGKGQFLWFV